MRSFTLGLTILALGCAADRGEEPLFGPGSDGGSETATDPGTSPDGDDATDGDAGEGAKFDVGNGDPNGGDPDGDAGCQKVDFLFVIDNSGSMEDEQQNLIGSFPGFVSAIRDKVEGEDYHMMVVTTDPKGWPNDGGGSMTSCHNGNCICTPTPDCCEDVCDGNLSCFGFPCTQLDDATDCDFEFGAGQRFGLVESRECLPAGQHYHAELPGADPAVLDEMFQCAANVGIYGDGNEMPMAAIEQAIDAARNGPGGCNEGFLRDDAVLVVTLITDEEDDHEYLGAVGSPGEPGDYYQALVTAKNDDPMAVVMLALIGDPDQPNGICPPGATPGTTGVGAEAAPRLRALTELFPYGVAGSVCAADYSPFLVDAVSVIDTACDEFVPPG